jgi:hypothetical protein
MTLYRSLLVNTIKNTGNNIEILPQDLQNTKLKCFPLDHDDNCVNGVDPLVCALLTGLRVSLKL